MDFVDTFIGRPNTVKTYKSLFYNWIDCKTPKPAQATHTTVVGLVTYWRQEQLSPQTIKTLLRLTERFLAYHGVTNIDFKSLHKISSNQKQQRQIVALSKEEATTLTRSIKKRDPEFYPVVMMALHTGMRKGEVFGLQWDDVDILKGNILVQRSYNGPTKNGKSRLVNISKSLEDVIFDIMPMKSDNLLGMEKVFDKQFDPSPKLKAACRRAKVKVITFHGLRHTFSTLALDAGKSFKEVQEALGHSKPSTTLDIYWKNTKGLMEMGFI